MVTLILQSAMKKVEQDVIPERDWERPLNQCDPRSPLSGDGDVEMRVIGRPM